MTLVALAYALAASAVGWAALLILGQGILAKEDRNRYLVAWFVLTVLMFMMPNGLSFLFVVVIFLLGLRASGADGVAVSAFLVAAVPPGVVPIFGLPLGINYLLDFSFAFFLCVVLLLPVVIRAGGPLPGARGTDLLVFAYAALIILLDFRGTTFTSGLRSMTLTVLVALVPYLAFSRAVRSPEHVRRVIGSFLACLIVASLIGFISSVVGWGIYDVVLRDVFGQFVFGYVYRAGLLRTGSTLGSSPISFGMLMMIGAFLAAALAADTRSRWHARGVIVCLMLGLLASVSRGPMVGTVAGLVAYQFVKPDAASALVKAGVASVVLAPLALLTPIGRDLARSLPFIGEADGGSVSYRQELATAGWQVIQRNPVFGSERFIEEPEMQAMVQGQGIVDLVNTYLTQALTYGLVGGTLFALVHIAALIGTFRAARRLAPGRPDLLREIGGGLFAAQFAFMVTIATVSLGGVLPFLSWMLPGLCVAYARVAKAAAKAAVQDEVREMAVETEAPAPVPRGPHERPSAPDPTPAPAPVFTRSTIGPQGWPDDMPSAASTGRSTPS